MKVFSFIFGLLLLLAVFKVYETHSIPIKKAASSADVRNSDVQRAQFKSREEYKWVLESKRFLSKFKGSIDKLTNWPSTTINLETRASCCPNWSPECWPNRKTTTALSNPTTKSQSNPLALLDTVRIKQQRWLTANNNSNKRCQPFDVIVKWLRDDNVFIKRSTAALELFASGP